MRIATLARDFGCVAVVTDPIDDRAREFSAGFDFVALPAGETLAKPDKSDFERSEKLPRSIVTVKTILAALAALEPREADRATRSH